MALLTNLISHWSMASTADDHGSNTLTVTGTATYAAAKLSNGLQLDGSTYVTAADSASLNPSADMTCALWINPASFANYPLLASKGVNGDFSWYCFANADGGGLLIWRIKTSGGTGYAQADIALSNLSTSAWNLVVLRYDGGGATDADKMKIYTANTERTCTFSGDAIPATLPDDGGVFCYGGGFSGGLSPFANNTILDNCAIWSEALGTTDLDSLWNGGSGLAYSGFAGVSAGFDLPFAFPFGLAGGTTFSGSTTNWRLPLLGVG